MRKLRNTVSGLFAVFLFPLAVNAALYATRDDRPRHWREANWSSVGMLSSADAVGEARVLVFTGRTGGLKGIFSVHSWIVLKPENAARWNRYDVVGWGNPIRTNGWAPDGRWYGDTPRVLVDVRGPEAAALIPKLQSAIANYAYRHNGDYRMWPGPNSNTFVATVLRAAPELAVTLPANAIGKDFRGGPHAGLTDSRTGVELSLYGLLGIKLAWVEGIEVNFLGAVMGLDVRHPAVKLPGFGRIGVADGSAIAAPAPRR
jgi:hypothetical protein